MSTADPSRGADRTAPLGDVPPTRSSGESGLINGCQRVLKEREADRAQAAAEAEAASGHVPPHFLHEALEVLSQFAEFFNEHSTSLAGRPIHRDDSLLGGGERFAIAPGRVTPPLGTGDEFGETYRDEQPSPARRRKRSTRRRRPAASGQRRPPRLDPEHKRRVRAKLLHHVEMVVCAVILIGLLVLAFLYKQDPTILDPVTGGIQDLFRSR